MLDQKKKVALKMAMVSRGQHSSLMITPFLAKHITEHYKIIELFTQFQNERGSCLN